MIVVTKHGVLLNKTSNTFENDGVLNPAAIRDGEFVHIFYRAVHTGNYSSIGYCKLKGPLNVAERSNKPIIEPSFDYESHGIEDPRIVKIDELYYLTYTAYDGLNALGALATSKDLIHFDKKGIIVPLITYKEFSRLAEAKKQLNAKYLRYNEHERIIETIDDGIYVWDKNLIFFPRRINGKLVFIHRIKPDIQIVVSINNLEELTEVFWQNYLLNFEESIILKPLYQHEISYVGGGCPPIETVIGWLIIYHGVCDTATGYVYSACAALLDLNHPFKEIARLPYALFKPEFTYEIKGEVNNVCFPTGTAIFDDTLYIYYGAADERIACASVSLSSLLKELQKNSNSLTKLNADETK